VIDTLIHKLTNQSYPIPQDLADKATHVLALMDALFKHEAVRQSLEINHFSFLISHFSFLISHFFFFVSFQTPVNALQTHLSELKYIEAGTTHAVLPRLINLFQACSFVPNPPITLLHYCLECIHGVARNNPALVWNLLKRANLLDGTER